MASSHSGCGHKFSGLGTISGVSEAAESAGELNALDVVARRLQHALERDDRDEVDRIVRAIPDEQMAEVWLLVMRKPPDPTHSDLPERPAESA
jgi:hypothetical protein